MDSLLKSDIFFFVTTLVVVCVGGLVGFALVYIIRILADIKKLSKKVEQEGERIVEDISLLRKNVKHETMRLSDILSFFFFRKKKVNRRKESDEIIQEEE